MQGGCFTISSIGGWVLPLRADCDAPEVAILGVSKSMEPVWNGKAVPRLMLPISLSFDHRVIDVLIVPVSAIINNALSDIRRLVM